MGGRGGGQLLQPSVQHILGLFMLRRPAGVGAVLDTGRVLIGAKRSGGESLPRLLSLALSGNQVGGEVGVSVSHDRDGMGVRTGGSMAPISSTP